MGTTHGLPNLSQLSITAAPSGGAGQRPTYSGPLDLPPGGAGNGGGGPGDVRIEKLEFRTSRLEDDFRRIEAKLEMIAGKISELAGGVSSLPTATEFGAIRNDLGRLEGRIAGLPTWRSMIWVVFVFGGVGGALIAALPELARLWLNAGQ